MKRPAASDFVAIENSHDVPHSNCKTFDVGSDHAVSRFSGKHRLPSGQSRLKEDVLTAVRPAANGLV